MTPDPKKADDAKPEEKKTWGQMFLLGIFNNSFPLALLFCVGRFLGLWKYVFIALGMQWAIFLLHGLPFQSERFYDLSGSMTHFAVVLASLMSLDFSEPVKSPR